MKKLVTAVLAVTYLTGASLGGTVAFAKPDTHAKKPAKVKKPAPVKAPVPAPKPPEVQAATVKCPSCGMDMPNQKSDATPVAVQMNGSTYYCCAGCETGKKAAQDAPKAPADNTAH